MKNTWFKEHLTDSRSSLPFSFTYDGQTSARLLAEWPAKVADERLDAQRIRRTIVWTDPKSGLEVRCVAVDYADYPAVEWTVWFKNTGATDTPILKDVLGMDAALAGRAGEEPTVHYIDGDGGFAPHDRRLGRGTVLGFKPRNGRPTDGCFPCYNLDWSDHGVIAAVGWPGQWSSTLSCDTQGAVRVQAGQELTHFKLLPGEEARAPLAVLLFKKGGGWIETQNLWRRWMRAHNMPKPGGKDVPVLRAGGAFLYAGLGWGVELLNEKEQTTLIDRFDAERIKLNCWWVDILGAGTHEPYTDAYIRSEDMPWMPAEYLRSFVTWETDRTRFPNGMRAVSDRAHAKGQKFLVWFEPEHVNANNVLYKQHPDWLLSVPDDPGIKKQINQGIVLGERRVVNLGNPAALKWTIEMFSRLIKDEGVDIYRLDFNIEPLLFWRHNDAPDRQGMTENLYVQGYLGFLDALLERHPRLLIDTCSSGGRRNDLETLRRAVPLWQSDHHGPDVVLQDQRYGLALWLPYFGTGTNAQDPYQFRSAFGSSLVTSWDVRDTKLNYDLLRRLNDEFWKVAPFFVEDYYPLAASGSWLAWQYNRSQEGDGMVQAFRRGDESAQTHRLYGLEPAAQYEVTNFDSAGTTVLSGGSAGLTTGKELMEQGLTVEIKDQPGAAVIVYRRLRPQE